MTSGRKEMKSPVLTCPPCPVRDPYCRCPIQLIANAKGSTMNHIEWARVCTPDQFITVGKDNE